MIMQANIRKITKFLLSGGGSATIEYAAFFCLVHFLGTQITFRPSN